MKSSLEVIGRGGEFGPYGRSPAKVSFGASNNAFTTHEAGDAVTPTANALLSELVVNAWRAIDLAVLGIGRADVHE